MTKPDDLRGAVEAYVAWQYRQKGAKRFVLSDLRAALSQPAAPPSLDVELLATAIYRGGFDVSEWHGEDHNDGPYGLTCEEAAAKLAAEYARLLSQQSEKPTGEQS